MQRYLPFAAVDVRHEYFADGSARHLQFQPHADTAAFLRRFGMMLRADERSLRIIVAEPQLQGIWGERMDDGDPRTLCFDVHSTDAACAYYTGAVDTQIEVAGDGARPPPLRPVQATPKAPLATVALPIDGAESNDFTTWVATLGATFQLRLQSRSTIWKYLLIGDWRDRSLSVIDQRGNVTFTTPVPERLPDGQHALAVHSTSTIALRERPPQRFQLHDVTDAPGRVLIPRLPGAVPQRLWRETVHGESTAVSEIFVHS